MRLIPALLTTLLVFSGYVQDAQAHSTRRDPLRTTRRVEDVLFATPEQRVHAASSFDMSFTVTGSPDERIRLDLTPNNDVISSETFVQIIGPDGVSRAVPLDRSEHRVFRGNAFTRRVGQSSWKQAGWARIVVLSDGESPIFEGAFGVNGDHYHVQTATNYRTTRQDSDPLPPTDATMVAWKDSDIGAAYVADDNDVLGSHELRRRDVASGCGVNDLHVRVETNETETGLTAFSIRDTSEFGSLRLARRASSVSTIGSTAGCPTTRRVALMGIAADCTYAASFSTQAELRSNLIAQVNTASALYERTFNISLAIRNLTVSDSTCPTTLTRDNNWNRACSANVDVGTRLSLFSAWRGRQTDNNAFWTLMSTCSSGSAVGIAWLGAVCMRNSQTDSSGTSVAGANYVARTTSEWQVLAHEIGHTFGAEHDCTSSTCSGTSGTSAEDCCPLSASTCDASGAYLMNPSARTGITDFSPCTIGSVCSQIGSGGVSTKCLVDNRDVQVSEGFAQCGNGIVETGEECDSDNPCCDPATCKYATNAKCDPASDGCCTDTCTVAAAGKVCRASTGSCDPQETCDGTAFTCPADVNNASDNGGSCTSGGSSSNGGDIFNVGDPGWWSKYGNIVIGVSAGVGGLIALIILGCIISSCRRRRRIRNQQRQLIAQAVAANSAANAARAGAGGMGGMGGMGPGGYVPPPMASVQPMPPSYYPPPMAQPSWPQRPARTMSARYA